MARYSVPRLYVDPARQVINTVTAIVDHLPADAFEDVPPSPPSIMDNRSIESLSDTLVSQPSNPKESAQNNIIREMVETERKYVQDLEIMQVSITLGPILARPLTSI